MILPWNTKLKCRIQPFLTRTDDDWPCTRSKTVSGDADMATVPGSSSAGGPVLEVLAHERLMPALRSAFEYVLAVCVCVYPENSSSCRDPATAARRLPPSGTLGCCSESIRCARSFLLRSAAHLRRTRCCATAPPSRSTFTSCSVAA